VRDPYRQRIAAVFELWQERHGFAAVTAAELAEDVKEAISPAKTSRQQIATAVQSLADTRVAGYAVAPRADREVVARKISAQPGVGAGGR
jgi:hypothetical protein